MRFKIVVPSFNSMPWLERTLASIETQDYPYYDVCVIDDASSDPRQREVITEYAERNGWKTIFNKENKGALYNHIAGVNALECEDEDVIVVVDGDDWLYNDKVLQRVATAYLSTDALITYGQFICYNSGAIGCPRKVRRHVIRRRNYRKHGWVFSHLRTYKYRLWKNIRDEDLRGPNGEYWETACDLATMFPMLEMAGPRIAFIPEVLYVYNDNNPISDWAIKLDEQQEANKLIRQKKKYARI